MSLWIFNEIFDLHKFIDETVVINFGPGTVRLFGPTTCVVVIGIDMI